MLKWNNESHLETIELLAEANYLISSEEELSERFDYEIAPHVIKQYGEDDEPAMNEAFNNWTDMLCKDGEIHPLQYNQYVYVGEWS